MPEVHISKFDSTPGWEDSLEIEEDVDEIEEDEFEDEVGYFD